MDGYLCRMRDGRYTLTGFKPKLVGIVGSEQRDFYIRYGDPIGLLRVFCAEGIAKYAPDCVMEPLSEPIKIELLMNRLDEER